MHWPAPLGFAFEAVFSHPEWKLLGMLIVMIGLMRRWRTGPVVLVAGVVTGLIAGLPMVGDATRPGILDSLGKAFTENRVITLYLLTLPAVGLAERCGLHVEAARLIRRIRGASVVRVLWLYQLSRVVMGAVGLRLNGHPTFGRPLIVPMATGLLDEERRSGTAGERVKAATAGSENYGNFFGQNLFPAAAGCLLMQGVLKGAGYSVDVLRLAKLAVPVVCVSLVFSAVQFAFLNKAVKAGKE
jgi:uncharacterized membrane protein